MFGGLGFGRYEGLEVWGSEDPGGLGVLRYEGLQVCGLGV